MVGVSDNTAANASLLKSIQENFEIQAKLHAEVALYLIMFSIVTSNKHNSVLFNTSSLILNA